MELVFALLVVAILASLPAAVLVVGVFTAHARPDSPLLRHWRLVATVGFSAWALLTLVSHLSDAPGYTGIGSGLGILLLVFVFIARSRASTLSSGTA
ncbi:hypothetical protein XM38_003330 [Halomicronema hongdechloris C2206]|uniref:Uncharacterized protein n=1 Tax=Halomicronema hongdechloris C2206 TaxID=1641165 RepID=A0A1Z3HGK0_9CYAN|nr:hypothetical protein [Halomicronema hongdechloris]ASC69406.1 hypothetical protein XM38_003330 [Halomicronema hongdechloris C2206]